MFNDRPVDDPYTRQALQEIADVYRRYDLAGGFILVNQQEWAYGYELDTTWNGVIPDKSLALGFRLRIKTADLGEALAQERAEGTAHLFCAMVDFATQTRVWFRDLLQLLRQGGMRIQHTPFNGHPLPRLRGRP